VHSEGCIAAALAHRISHASLAAVLSKLGQDTVLAVDFKDICLARDTHH
jgi:hypothetical protein